MNKERMFLLADLLKKVKPMQFNMSDWFSVYTGEDDYTEEDIYYEHAGVFSTNNVMVMNGYDCNAAACIAGWAVVLKNDFNVNNPNMMTVNSSSAHNWEDRIANNELPVMKEALDYLELSISEANGLFCNSGSDNPWNKYSEELGFDDPDDISLEQITPAMASVMLENLATGKWTFDD